MNVNYKQSVIIFGIVIPVLFLAVLSAAVFFKASSVKKEYLEKEREIATAKRVKQQNIILKKQSDNQKETLSNWEALLATNDRASFLKQWKIIAKEFKKNEFEHDRPSWENQSSGIGLGSKQAASQVTMNFNATYRAMQTALIQMETRMPQMQLDSMTMKPNSDGKTMEFTTTFTVWTKE